MQTRLPPELLRSRDGREADRILRQCVHCGFCNTDCPTYRLFGDELDGPRGRIYQIKRFLEGEASGAANLLRLDRCLNCRACETACPSGVEYSRLLDLARPRIAARYGRALPERLKRRLGLAVLPRKRRLAAALALARLLRFALPARLRRRLPPQPPRPQSDEGGAGGKRKAPPVRHVRRMLILEGCVQSVTAPDINRHCRRLLERMEISLLEIEDACCGALAYHLEDKAAARATMRRNIDRLWPQLEQGAEAVVGTASGCGSMIKEYGYLLRDDPAYAAKARRVSEAYRDIAEVLAAAPPGALRACNTRAAVHIPCTLQHGQSAAIARLRATLTAAGLDAPLVEGPCCGSAGFYSLAQPRIAERLLHDKLRELARHPADVIATANIGCQLHLQSASAKPVRHWTALLRADAWDSLA